jgi:flagellar assembly protein FliH
MTPLLSRVFKKPRISGTYRYPVPGPAAGQAGAATVKSAGEKAGPPGGSKHRQKEGLSSPEDNDRDAALAQKERLESAARQGYLEGLAEGKAEAEARARELLEEASRKLKEAEQEAAASLQQARQKAREIVSASEADIVELSVAIAEKLIQDQLEIAPQKVARVVQESLRHFSDEEEQLAVYLHPVDLPACRKSLEQVTGAAALETRLKLLPDERLPRGSCRIESESSTVEYLLDEELKKIRETLLQIASTKEQTESQEEELTYVSH